MNKRIAAICLTLLSVLVLQATAQTPGESRMPALDYEFVDSYMDYRVYDLPPELVYMERFGNWNEGGRSGIHRLIIVEALDQEPRHHLLYVQWVCHCEDGVVSMQPVSEINRSSQMVYARPQFDRQGVRAIAELTGRDYLTNQVREFRLRMMSVGNYEVDFN